MVNTPLTKNNSDNPQTNRLKVRCDELQEDLQKQKEYAFIKDFCKLERG